MHNPPHPGEVLREGWLAPLGLTVTAAAEALGVTRSALAAILAGDERIDERITPAVALSLAMTFDTTPQSCLDQQALHDRWRAR